MSFFVVAIFKALILEGLALLALVDASLHRTRRVRWARTAAYGAVGALAWLAFLNFGSIHGHGSLPHWSEQYHFDLGDKYLRELRYDGLYLATAAAATERHDLLPVNEVRDTKTFELIPRGDVPRLAEAARARFSPERWTAFVDDLEALLAHDPRAASTADHGNTSSPAGAIVPWALLRVVPMRGSGFVGLALADLAMLAAAFVACWRWGSLRVAAAGFALALLAPYETDYLLGSLFRFDWIAASLAATVALARGKRATSGALFAYAALARPFAAAFGFCAFVGLVGDLRRRDVDRRAVQRFALGAVGCAAALAVVSTLLFRASIWPEYVVRLLATAREGYYGLSYSLRNIYAQIASQGATAIFQPVPDFVAAARPGAIEALRGLGLVQAAFAVLLLFLCYRDGAVMGAGVGVLLVFALLVTNAYYQSMWGVLALACALHGPKNARARIGLALACAAFASRYVMQHFGNLGYAHDYFGNWTAFAFMLVWTLAALVSPRMGPVATAQN
jgi:hypothetical protein